MTLDKEKATAEELSKMIDELNKGKKLETIDSEASELMDVAAMVKMAAGQSNPPQQAIDFLAEHLTDRTNSNKRKRRVSWLYSGAASAAAAVLLVVATNLMPLNLDKDKMVVPPEINISQVTPQAEAPINPAIQQGNVATKTAVPPAVRTEKKTDAVPRSTAEGKKVSDAAISYSAPVKEEMPREKAMPPAEVNKSLKSAKIQEEKQAAILSIPGRNATSRTFDNTTGVVKQTYAMDNDKEVVIIQKSKNSKAIAAANSGHSVTEADKNTGEGGVKLDRTKANKVTTAVNDYEVTVEGEFPNDELQEIADSLVETED